MCLVYHVCWQIDVSNTSMGYTLHSKLNPKQDVYSIRRGVKIDLLWWFKLMYTHYIRYYILGRSQDTTWWDAQINAKITTADVDQTFTTEHHRQVHVMREMCSKRLIWRVQRHSDMHMRMFLFWHMWRIITKDNYV